MNGVIDDDLSKHRNVSGFLKKGRNNTQKNNTKGHKYYIKIPYVIKNVAFKDFIA